MGAQYRTKEKLKDLIHLSKKDEAAAVFTDWERGFLTALKGNFEDPNWLPTPRQERKIEEIWGSLYDQ